MSPRKLRETRCHFREGGVACIAPAVGGRCAQHAGPIVDAVYREPALPPEWVEAMAAGRREWGGPTEDG